MKKLKLEELIAKDRRGVFTILAIASAIGLLINSIVFRSPLAGVAFTTLYFLINSILVGDAVFREESANFRILFGLLVTLMLIALGGASLIVVSAIFPIRFDAKATVAILTLATAGVWVIRRKRIAGLLGLRAP